MAERTVAAPETSYAPATRENTRTQERYVTPPVDIYETPEGLVVMADLPGVTPETLDVRVDNHLLTIRSTGQASRTGEAVHREYELVNFFRQFELSDRVDESRITADLKHGVLHLSLPKAEAAKPRQIQVHTV
jgi:HSP20 family molecular chaperone IbpA